MSLLRRRNRSWRWPAKGLTERKLDHCFKNQPSRTINRLAWVDARSAESGRTDEWITGTAGHRRVTQADMNTKTTAPKGAPANGHINMITPPNALTIRFEADGCTGPLESVDQSKGTPNEPSVCNHDRAAGPEDKHSLLLVGTKNIAPSRWLDA